jgi:hypothetical protein
MFQWVAISVALLIPALSSVSLRSIIKAARAFTLTFDSPEYLLRLAGRNTGFKVVLTGEDWDEILGDYFHCRRGRFSVIL